MAHVSEFKKKIVQDLVKLSKEYPIVGVVNMENLPAPQLQSMKAELRGKVNLFMTKKTLMKIALEKIKEEKKGIEALKEYFDGMPALIFTKDSPFKLSKILKKNKTAAPAKAGQTAPNDIIVPKGPTPFAPGPIISELSSIGLQVGVESGKVAVKEDSVVAKKGEKIKPKVAEVLIRLDIKPMEVGLGLVAAYEDGIIYQKDVLDIDETEYINNVNLASVQAFNLAFNITYITKDNVKIIIGKAFNDAKALGISQKILDTGVIKDLLSKAERSMLNLKSTANIEIKEKAVEEPKKEETKPVEKEKPKEKPKVVEKKEEPKPEVKEEKKPTEEKPKEKPKVEEKKEEPKPEPKEEKKEVKEEAKPEVKEIKEPEKKIEEKKPEVKEEEPKIEAKEPEKEEDIYEEEKREELVAQGEISPAEEGFMEGYEEAGKTKEEKKEEEKVQREVDKKVSQIVEQTKKFMKGEEETAADIIEEVKKEEKKEEKAKEKPKVEEKKEEVPSAHDLKKEKEEKETKSAEELKKEKEAKEQKEVEELAKELVKKGTLRKK